MTDTTPTFVLQKGLPDYVQDHSLLNWPAVAAVLGCSIPTARKIVKDNSIPLVPVSERKRLPRWGSIRQFIESRETASAA